MEISGYKLEREYEESYFVDMGQGVKFSHGVVGGEEKAS